MDISEEYIKMCREAKELYENWKWNEGDFYAGKVHDCKDNDFKINWPIETGVSSEDQNPNYRVNCGENWYSEVWPLFRIDQLHKLSGYTWVEFYKILYLNWWNYDSPEPAGLSFIMASKFNKNWDGRTWK